MISCICQTVTALKSFIFAIQWQIDSKKIYISEYKNVYIKLVVAIISQHWNSKKKISKWIFLLCGSFNLLIHAVRDEIK